MRTIRLEETETQNRKQDIYDFFKKRNDLAASKIQFFANEGKLELEYPSGFKYTLRYQDFPTRNYIPHYQKVDGTYRIFEYFVEEDMEVRT